MVFLSLAACLPVDVLARLRLGEAAVLVWMFDHQHPTGLRHSHIITVGRESWEISAEAFHGSFGEHRLRWPLVMWRSRRYLEIFGEDA
jgi:hypothetical protein